MTPPALRTVFRRSALAGIGAASLGIALGSRAHASAQDTPRLPTEIVHDLAYGEDERYHLMDAVRPKDRSTPVPAVVLLHGGSFVQGSRSDMFTFATFLAMAGYAAYSVEYRLFDRSTGANAWPAALDDVQRAVRWLRANAAEQGVDIDRIGAIGPSTGGHLAGFLGTRETRDNGNPALAEHPSKVACAVAMAGEMDFTIPLGPDDATLYAALIGGTPGQPPPDDAYRDLSPMTFVDGSTAPFLIVHGAANPWVSVEHSRHMVEALHMAGVEAIYAEFPDLAHLEVFNWSLVGSLVLAFLDRHLDVAR